MYAIVPPDAFAPVRRAVRRLAPSPARAAVEDFLSLLAFLFFFFVLPALQKRKARRRRQEQRPAEFQVPPQPQPQPRPRSASREPDAGRQRPQPEPRAETPFQDALRQIREALEEAQQEPSARQEQPAPQPPPLPHPTRKPTRLPDPHPSPLAAPPPIRLDRRTGFESESVFERGPSAHERHGFGRENPLSEESFERRPVFAPEPGARHPAAFDPHRLRQPPAAVPASRRQATLLERLRRPSTAQDALIMAEVLGPPKGKLRR